MPKIDLSRELDAYSDETPEDRANFEAVVRAGRKKITARAAIATVVRYLTTMIDVQEKEISRYRREGDRTRCAVAVERKRFAESMLLWMGRNA